MSTPDSITAGDSLAFGVNVEDKYKPALGWAFRQIFVPRFTTPTQSRIEIAGTANGTIDGVTYDFIITTTPGTTALWKPGEYGWWRQVSKTGERVTLDDLDSSGQLIILADPLQQSQGFDNRTQAQIALANCREALAAFRSTGVLKSVTEGDRSVTFETGDDLMKRLAYWEAVVAREDADAAMAAGLKNPRGIHLKLNRV